MALPGAQHQLPPQGLPSISSITNGLPSAAAHLPPDQLSLSESTRDSGTWPQPHSKRKFSSIFEVLCFERSAVCTLSLTRSWARHATSLTTIRAPSSHAANITFYYAMLLALTATTYRQLGELSGSSSTYSTQPRRLTTAQLNLEHAPVRPCSAFSTLDWVTTTLHQPRLSP